MTKLTQREINAKSSTFECLLISKLSKSKYFDLLAFNSFIEKDQFGVYKNGEIQKEFEQWIARTERELKSDSI